jgi:hypothetical protein
MVQQPTKTRKTANQKKWNQKKDKRNAAKQHRVEL